MSRLSDVLNELSRSRRMNQPQIVKRSNEMGVPLSKGNVSRYLSGKHPEKPQIATLTAFAKVLDVSVEELEEAATYTGREPFEAHPSSDLLTAPQRAAVNEIIRLMAEGNKGADDATQAEDQAGSSENVQGAGPGTPIDLAQARKVKDDPTAFGDQPRRGDLDQGKLQPPPARGKSAAYEPDAELEGPAEARKSRERGEGSQERPDGDE